MTINKFTILKSQLPPDYTMNQKKEWENQIIIFLTNYLKYKKYSLLELEPTNHSLIYDYLSFEKVEVNNKLGIFVRNINLTPEELKTLVIDEDFYLGHILIVTSEVFLPFTIFELWNKNIFESNSEIITLKDDGLSFYLHNPTEEAYRLFLKTF